LGKRCNIHDFVLANLQQEKLGKSGQWLNVGDEV